MTNIAPVTADLARRLLAGERAALARAITLIESRRPDHQAEAQALLRLVLPHAGRARRIGITGVPGVGKSSFIEAFGTMLTGAGHKVAVLAVDPSSTRTGGSILGDKTRMARLATDPAAFVRPSPSAGMLGGVARATREAGLLCEATGYDVVLVETVGVGQSETSVADMVDLFLVLMLPGAGDELQGIKKGLIELADLIAVNKADGEQRLAAEQARRHYANALRILLPEDAASRPDVLTVSALTGAGLPELWAGMVRWLDRMSATGQLDQKRRTQQLRWLDALLHARLLELLARDPGSAAELARCRAEVAAGTETPLRAVERVLAAFAADQKPNPMPTPTLLP
ncbi:methylmalonyl Co-A mutase-associated GTPase MeaB [Geminicoccus harenae]|uniref:methylmalonyl Co-A mutase-associated GTPase MeaB n=1 Tax=Geminicoccus harenae TaxID=2498453 RepID=UPI00168C0D65|nr:methylmalonyl Co-A mutase-associated GTPase MeaB [Geminicoccus harenae]